ncbi:MAG: hypothetical protein ACRENH_03420 [Gemmatimonadaceae bacterium]
MPELPSRVPDVRPCIRLRHTTQRVPMDKPPNELSDGEPPPLGQRLFDNVYLLLGLGLLVMLLVFTAWGIWEVLSMPQGTLP